MFLRELISNSSDALEKLRYLQLTGAVVEDPQGLLEIHIRTDENKKTFTIQVCGLRRAAVPRPSGEELETDDKVFLIILYIQKRSNYLSQVGYRGIVNAHQLLMGGHTNFLQSYSLLFQTLHAIYDHLWS